MKPPVTATVDWKPEDADEPTGEQITKRGKHHVANFVEKKRQENVEHRERYLRDLGGKERDRKRIPPPEFASSGRTDKSSSKVRFPSRAFLRNWELIDWGA